MPRKRATDDILFYKSEIEKKRWSLGEPRVKQEGQSYKGGGLVERGRERERARVDRRKSMYGKLCKDIRSHIPHAALVLGSEEP